MKIKLLFSFIVISLGLSLASCNSCSNKDKEAAQMLEEQRQKATLKPEMLVTRDDTAQVLDLVKEYFNLVQNKKYDEAMAMLYYLGDGDKIQTPPKVLYDKERAAMAAFPVYGYEIEYLKFYKETDSEVKYTIYMQDPKKVSKPASMSGMLRPMRRDSKWYLTVADAFTDRNQSELDH